MKTVSVIVALTLATPAFAAPSRNVSENRLSNSVASPMNPDESACFGMGGYNAIRLAKETDASNSTYSSGRKNIDPEGDEQWTEYYCQDDED